MFHYRFLGASCAIALLGSAGPVAAELNQKAYLNAYEHAVRCFAVAPFAKDRGIKSDDGDRAFATAYKLGANLGYTSKETADDVKRRVNIELQAMHRDAAYLAKAISDCQRLKLLS